MTYVALGALAALYAGYFLAGGLIRSLVRTHAREREQLLNRLMHLADKTWEPPPAEQWKPEPERFDPDRFVSSVAQQPDEF